MLVQADIEPDMELATLEKDCFKQGPSLRLQSVPYFLFFRTVRKTYNIRRRYNDIPQLPGHPIRGNLINCGENLACSRHPNYRFEGIWASIGRSSCSLMDLSLVGDTFPILPEPQIAEAIVYPSKRYKYSAPKSVTLAHLPRLISVQPKHIYSLTPSAVTKTRMSINRLEKAANDGRAFTRANYE